MLVAKIINHHPRKFYRPISSPITPQYLQHFSAAIVILEGGCMHVRKFEPRWRSRPEQAGHGWCIWTV